MATMNDPIWQKLFDDLVVHARKHLGHLPKRMKDEEDIAASVMKSFFRGVEQGNFELPEDDGFSLWPLLSLIATRKCADLAVYLKAQKRDIRKVTEAEIDEIVGKGASPFSIVAQEEDRQRLLDALPVDRLRQVAQWKMEGFTNKEMAVRLGCVERTVEMRVKIIREIWAKYVEKAWEESIANHL